MCCSESQCLAESCQKIARRNSGIISRNSGVFSRNSGVISRNSGVFFGLSLLQALIVNSFSQKSFDRNHEFCYYFIGGPS